MFSPGFVDLAFSHPSSFECLVAFPPPKPPVEPGWDGSWCLAQHRVGTDFLIRLLTHIMPPRPEKAEHLFIKLCSRYETPQRAEKIMVSERGGFTSRLSFPPMVTLGILFTFSETLCHHLWRDRAHAEWYGCRLPSSLVHWDLICVLVSRIMGSKPALRLWLVLRLR